LELGQALVEELGLDPGVDTLGRWMAHHIAELITSVETAKDEDRPAGQAECADAILALWERRHQLPNGKRPFEDLESILRALESLDPTVNAPRYFRAQRVIADDTEENEETKQWLELADDLDYSARLLIRHCLTQAAQTAIDKSKDWVKLVEAAGLENSIDLSIIRILTDERDLTNASEPDDAARKQLEDRICRLATFKKMANTLESDLRRQLGEV